MRRIALGAADYSIAVVAVTRFGGEPPQPDWQMARALAERHPVLYVDPPTFVHAAARTHRWRSLVPSVEHVAPNTWVLRPVASPGADRPRFARLGDAVINPQIRRAARRSLPGGPLVVMCSSPRRGAVSDLGDMYIYVIPDPIPDPAHRFPEHMRARHHSHIHAADLVTGVSDVFVDEAEAFGAPALLVANAAEYDMFAAPAHRPSELPTDRVVVGFAGGVTSRIDMRLVAALTEAEPDWLIALVGEVCVDVPDSANLLVTGPRPYSEMPAWMQHFDVGLVPYLDNQWNRASFPLKTYEYLAAGTPVVATPLPMLQGLDPAVRVGGDPESFVAAVRHAVAEGPRGEPCREVARANSWNARARLVEDHVEAFLSSHAA